uniref:Uncharacterized protein n=2 Tax=Anguilla anguilla TaxID=7936 RepID=A0A0E9XTV7_ANGAN
MRDRNTEFSNLIDCLSLFASLSISPQAVLSLSPMQYSFFTFVSHFAVHQSVFLTVLLSALLSLSSLCLGLFLDIQMSIGDVRGHISARVQCW